MNLFYFFTALQYQTYGTTEVGPTLTTIACQRLWSNDPTMRVTIHAQSHEHHAKAVISLWLLLLLLCVCVHVLSWFVVASPPDFNAFELAN